MKVQRCHIWN